MQRITEAMLENLADRINDATDSPDQPWNCAGDANIGIYHISYANGGVSLHRMTSSGGGVSCPIQNYHSPKRELYGLMDAYLSGLSARVKNP